MSDIADQHFDIQALFRGFGTTWPWALFAYIEFGDDPKRNQAFLKQLPRALGCGDRPTSVSRLDTKRADPKFDRPFNVAFTYGGLSKLGVAPDILSSFASEFIQGMRNRARVNHDYGRSAPQRWEGPWSKGSVDMWIGIYARTEQARKHQRDRLTRYLATFKNAGIQLAGLDVPRQITAEDTPLWLTDPASQPRPDQAVEHFGFGDGISNPPIKGLARSRTLKSFPGGKIDASGKWQPLAAGEFLHGHLDEIGEVPPGPSATGIGRNGSYLVLRKLSQDVDAFRKYVSDWATRHGVGADDLAAKLVGKTRDGMPLIQPNPKHHRTDFSYAGDKLGLMCPKGSHVRRTNPRDTFGDDTLLVDRHRILRRGIPYGELVPRGRKMREINQLDSATDAGKPYPGQGLMFLALNVDIRRQFEFVQSEWVNFGNDLNQGSDRDPIVGASHSRHREHNRIVILSEREEGIVMCPQIPSFVETRGGDYFYRPGLSAYAGIANGQFQ
jgi:Dyp-type peroxidase family